LEETGGNPMRYERTLKVMRARRIFRTECPGNVYFTVSKPRKDGTFRITGCVHSFLNDGLKDDYLVFSKDVEIIERGQI
jgi:hypothetical protein